MLDNHDGELLPTLEVARAGHPPDPRVEGRHRARAAAQRLPPRPPLHRRPGPGRRLHGRGAQRRPDTPPLRKNPVFLYFQDGFQQPQPVPARRRGAIDDVLEKKVGALDAHASQFYEWLPWVAGELDQVPEGPAARRRVAASERCGRTPSPSGCARRCAKRYGAKARREGRRRRGVRDVRVRPPAHEGRAAPALPVLRLELRGQVLNWCADPGRAQARS